MSQICTDLATLTLTEIEAALSHLEAKCKSFERKRLTFSLDPYAGASTNSLVNAQRSELTELLRQGRVFSTSGAVGAVAAQASYIGVRNNTTNKTVWVLGALVGPGAASIITAEDLAGASVFGGTKVPHLSGGAASDVGVTAGFATTGGAINFRQYHSGIAVAQAQVPALGLVAPWVELPTGREFRVVGNTLNTALGGFITWAELPLGYAP